MFVLKLDQNALCLAISEKVYGLPTDESGCSSSISYSYRSRNI